MNGVQNKKIFSKENSHQKKKRKHLFTNLDKSKENEKNTTNNNTTSYTNSKIERKTLKKDFNNKINYINIQSIIKKIDLYSITRKSKNIIKLNLKKQKILNIRNNNSNVLKGNQDKLKKKKDSFMKIFSKRNFIKENNKHDNDFTFENLTEQRYKNKNKGNAAKIRLSKLNIIKFDNYSGYEPRSNKDLVNNSINPRSTNNNKLYKIIKHDLSSQKAITKLNGTECHMNNLEKKEKLMKKNNIFRRNNTEFISLNLTLDNLINSKRSLQRNNIETDKQKKMTKKKGYIKNKKFLTTVNNTKIGTNSEDNTHKITSKKRELKGYLVKRKLDSLDLPKTIIQKKTKTSSNKKTKKQDYIKKIPRPLITNNNLIMNMNEMYNNISNIPKNTQKTYVYTENRRHFSNEMLNTNIDSTIQKTDLEIPKESYKQNYLIDNALINIREYSFPGETKEGHIKINQDSYIIQRNINCVKNFNIFAVFDGHGYNGHIISEYLKENLIRKIKEHPKIKLLKNLRYIYAQFIYDNYEIIREIFQELDNEILNNDKFFNTDLSGSTCTLIIQIGDNIICANVGDSKAVLIAEDKNIININDEIDRYKICKLSKDSTPYIETEKMRIQMNGGKIKQIKNGFNNKLGPLRIFVKNGNFPGLTITRSFGDKIGKSIGVLSKPFINQYILNKSVRYIVIASSGIWHFVQEKEILEIGKKFYSINDPDNFCKEIANRATKLCKQSSGNIDDITIIVIFFTFI